MSDAEDVLRFHGFLLRDTGSRLDAYERALRRVVRPASVVLDLGAGTGILAFLACDAGARHVYAIERAPVAEYARVLMRANGVSDRVSILRDSSFAVELPERVDVIVADTFGTFGLHSGGFTALIDARRRMLKPDGVILPTSVEFAIAPAETPNLYHDLIDRWAGGVHGLDLSSLRSRAVNTSWGARLDERMLLGVPGRIADVRLSEVSRPDIHGTATISIVRRGVLHGLCGWFNAHLDHDIVLSNAPGATTTNYAQTFLPLDRPVNVEAGDSVSVAIDHLDGEVLRWRVDIMPRPSAWKGSCREPEHFDHCTFLGAPLTANEFRTYRSNLPSG